MAHTPTGHVEQLPSGSWRAKVYAGTDPLTGREIRFRKTRKTEVEAQIELGKLLALARAGGQPDSDVTVAELIDEYVPVAGRDLSTEESNLGYIRRTIKPALGAKEVRRVRGPLLHNLCPVAVTWPMSWPGGECCGGWLTIGGKRSADGVAARAMRRTATGGRTASLRRPLAKMANAGSC